MLELHQWLVSTTAVRLLPNALLQFKHIFALNNKVKET